VEEIAIKHKSTLLNFDNLKFNCIHMNPLGTSIAIVLILVSGFGANSQTPQAYRALLQPDQSIPIPKLTFDAKDDSVITASATSSNHDFDALVGKWKMYHRRLNKRLENCKDWTEFTSVDTNYLILDGKADMDIYRTTEMPGMEGKMFEGVTMRLFNPTTRLWSLYWVASDRGVLDPPMDGSFNNGIGHFFAKDTYNGKPVIVMFRWDFRDKTKLIWSQAFSPDKGKTWEWNWVNVSVR
jgi:hypothetical protein